MIPGIRALPTGALPGRDAQRAGGHAHGAPDPDVALAGPVDELPAGFLQRRGVLGGERDANFVLVLPTNGVGGGCGFLGRQRVHDFMGVEVEKIGRKMFCFDFVFFVKILFKCERDGGNRKRERKI